MSHAFRLPNSAGRTHQAAEVAANAAGADKARTATLVVEDNSLVTTVATRYLTTAAADAQLMVELRINDGVAIKRVGIQEQRQRLADECLERR